MQYKAARSVDVERLDGTTGQYLVEFWRPIATSPSDEKYDEGSKGKTFKMVVAEDLISGVIKSAFQPTETVD